MQITEIRIQIQIHCSKNKHQQERFQWYSSVCSNEDLLQKALMSSSVFQMLIVFVLERDE